MSAVGWFVLVLAVAAAVWFVVVVAFVAFGSSIWLGRDRGGR